MMGFYEQVFSEKYSISNNNNNKSSASVHHVTFEIPGKIIAFNHAPCKSHCLEITIENKIIQGAFHFSPLVLIKSTTIGQKEKKM